MQFTCLTLRSHVALGTVALAVGTADSAVEAGRRAGGCDKDTYSLFMTRPRVRNSRVYCSQRESSLTSVAAVTRPRHLGPARTAEKCRGRKFRVDQSETIEPRIDLKFLEIHKQVSYQ